MTSAGDPAPTDDITYLRVLRYPGIAQLIASTLIARVPFGMLSLLYLLHIEQTFDSYAAAGAVLAASAAGQAVAGPTLSRLMGIWGLARVIRLAALAVACGLIALALLPLSFPGALALGSMVGLSTPPIQPAARSLYPRLVPEDATARLYSLDAITQELIWIAGPLLAIIVGVTWTPAAGLCTAAGLLLVGTLLFTTDSRVRATSLPRSTGRLGAVLRRERVRVVVVISLGLVCSFAAIEASLVAHFGDGSYGPGVVAALMSAGSLIGGLLFGHRPVKRWSLVVRMSFYAVWVIAGWLWMNDIWLAVTLFIASLAVAPAFAAVYITVSQAVDADEIAEAYGWVTTGQLLGTSLGAAAAGVAIDLWFALGGYGTAVCLAILAAAVACIGAARDRSDLAPAHENGR